MHKTKGITVLVAVLNKADTIKACIESLLKLRYPAVRKIMVIDGFSKDGTYEILKQYEDKIALMQFSGNLSATFNLALDKINTELTALTDGDCIVEEDWLNELVKGFENAGVIAAAGFCGTPKNLSLLQTLIGLELESRFKKFPKYISRAPTMNLLMNTRIARKVRFDEKQRVGVETDFGYRLTKFGKMAYTPKARVLHYHRASLKNYFKQQKSQAMGGVRIVSRHKKQALSDHITTGSMTTQIPLFFLTAVLFIASVFNVIFLAPLAFTLLLLLLIYLKTIKQIAPPMKFYLPFIGLFLVRTLAWCVGASKGLLLLFTEGKNPA